MSENHPFYRLEQRVIMTSPASITSLVHIRELQGAEREKERYPTEITFVLIAFHTISSRLFFLSKWSKGVELLELIHTACFEFSEKQTHDLWATTNTLWVKNKQCNKSLKTKGYWSQKQNHAETKNFVIITKDSSSRANKTFYLSD